MGVNFWMFVILVVGVVFITVAEMIKEYIVDKKKPTPQAELAQEPFVLAMQDKAKWPLKDAAYIKSEPFLPAILQVFERQPWAEMGLIKQPNSISSRDSFVQALCWKHNEIVKTLLDQEKTKRDKAIKRLLDGVKTMLDGVQFECHRCQACLTKKETMGQYVAVGERCKLPEELMQLLIKQSQ